MQALRRRLRKRVQLLRNHEHLAVYATLRKHWDSRHKENDYPRTILSERQLTSLLVDRPPRDLSMEDITDVADSFSVQPPTDSLAALAVQRIVAANAFPLPKKPGPLECLFGGVAQETCKKFSLWLGYVAAPLAATSGRYDRVLALASYLARRLGSAEYKGVEGAGNGGADGILRLLMLAPALTGICEHYPNFGPNGGSRRAVLGQLGKLCAFLESQKPLTECVSIRLAALICVGGLRAGEPFLAHAEEAARDRSELELAETFRLFRNNSELLDLPAATGRRGRRAALAGPTA